VRVEPGRLELGQLTVELERNELLDLPAIHCNLSKPSHTKSDGNHVP
jgi:hypothetical protein